MTVVLSLKPVYRPVREGNNIIVNSRAQAKNLQSCGSTKGSTTWTGQWLTSLPVTAGHRMGIEHTPLLCAEGGPDTLLEIAVGGTRTVGNGGGCE
jgi:hypothetical protein